MAISEELLARAMRGDRRATEEVLAEVYPAVFRLAYALTGRPGAARQVLHDVLRRSLRVMPSWRRGTVPENWFYHHTVITSRSASPQPPSPRDDVLLKQSGANDPAYRALLRTIRTLPRQQGEAFILHHGERLNTRLMGVAMDCSQGAATEHLRAAEQTVSEVVGDAAPALIGTMEQAYAALAPPPGAVRPAARKYISRHQRPRKIKRFALLLLLLALVAAGYYLWRSRDLIRSFVPASEPSAIMALQRTWPCMLHCLPRLTLPPPLIFRRTRISGRMESTCGCWRSFTTSTAACSSRSPACSPVQGYH